MLVCALRRPTKPSSNERCLPVRGCARPSARRRASGAIKGLVMITMATRCDVRWPRGAQRCDSVTLGAALMLAYEDARNLASYRRSKISRGVTQAKRGKECPPPNIDYSDGTSKAPPLVEGCVVEACLRFTSSLSHTASQFFHTTLTRKHIPALCDDALGMLACLFYLVRRISGPYRSR